jgi:hypothetical protein
MIARFVSAALLVAPLAACTVEKAPPNTPPPATAPAPATTEPVATVTEPCKPIGLWKAVGPSGATEIKVAQSMAKPGTFDVSYKGANLPNAGTQNGDKFNVDLGQSTGGIYNCTMGANCNQMSCGFSGQAPTVFNKAE